MCSISDATQRSKAKIGHSTNVYIYLYFWTMFDDNNVCLNDVDDNNGQQETNHFLILKLAVATATSLDSSDKDREMNHFAKWTFPAVMATF